MVHESYSSTALAAFPSIKRTAASYMVWRSILEDFFCSSSGSSKSNDGIALLKATRVQGLSRAWLLIKATASRCYGGSPGESGTPQSWLTSHPPLMDDLEQMSGERPRTPLLIQDAAGTPQSWLTSAEEIEAPDGEASCKPIPTLVFLAKVCMP